MQLIYPTEISTCVSLIPQHNDASLRLGTNSELHRGYTGLLFDNLHRHPFPLPHYCGIGDVTNAVSAAYSTPYPRSACVRNFSKSVHLLLTVSQRHQTGSELRYANITTPQTSSRDQVSSVVTAHQLVPRTVSDHCAISCFFLLTIRRAAYYPTQN
jgi:hypothetical protein